jgi:uncharacterized protein (DUF488 family)
MRTVYTIGHSTHPLDEFIALLRKHGVTAVADVRSAPYSRFNPQFNKDALSAELKANGIQYVFLGRELGARTEDRSCYEDGRVRYGRLARTPLFNAGIERVLRGAESYRLALLCAEKEPLDCHRTLLVGRELEAHGASVVHIHADGRLETQSDALTRLLTLLGLPEGDLFRQREELIEEACARQEAKIAYVDPGERPLEGRHAR